MEKSHQQLNWAGEPVPSEEQQELWSRITVVVSILLGLLVFL